MADIINENMSPAIDSVNYHVVANPAASKAAGKEIYTGQVDIKETYGIADIAKRMVAEGCAVKETAVRLVLSEFAELVGKLMSEGRAVNIGGLVRFAPSVRGVFESEDAPWNPAEHQVVVNATVGTRLRSAAAGSSIQRINPVTMPVLSEVFNMYTYKYDTICSEGHFMVMGERLTWNPAAADEGFFVYFEGIDTKCLTVESVQDPTCAVLVCTQLFYDAGVELELFFRTRQGGTVLRQVKYSKMIYTEIRPVTP